MEYGKQRSKRCKTPVGACYNIASRACSVLSRSEPPSARERLCCIYTQKISSWFDEWWGLNNDGNWTLWKLINGNGETLPRAWYFVMLFVIMTSQMCMWRHCRRLQCKNTKPVVMLISVDQFQKKIVIAQISSNHEDWAFGRIFFLNFYVPYFGRAACAHRRFAPMEFCQ